VGPSRVESGTVRSGRVGSGRVESGKVGSGRFGSGRVGSVRVESGKLGSARVGSGRVGTRRVGSRRVGPGRVGSGGVGSGRVGSGWVGPGRVGSGRVGSGRVVSGRVGCRVGSGRAASGGVRSGRAGLESEGLGPSKGKVIRLGRRKAAHTDGGRAAAEGIRPPTTTSPVGPPDVVRISHCDQISHPGACLPAPPAPRAHQANSTRGTSQNPNPKHPAKLHGGSNLKNYLITHGTRPLNSLSPKNNSEMLENTKSGVGAAHHPTTPQLGPRTNPRRTPDVLRTFSGRSPDVLRTFSGRSPGF
jgi:hypothetical protein